MNSLTTPPLAIPSSPPLLPLFALPLLLVTAETTSLLQNFTVTANITSFTPGPDRYYHSADVILGIVIMLLGCAIVIFFTWLHHIHKRRVRRYGVLQDELHLFSTAQLSEDEDDDDVMYRKFIYNAVT